MPNIAQLMTTAEVAEQCGGVSVKTVIRWVESGALTPAQKLPGLRGAYVFHPAEVARFKSARERRTA